MKNRKKWYIKKKIWWALMDSAKEDNWYKTQIILLLLLWKYDCSRYIWLAVWQYIWTSYKFYNEFSMTKRFTMFCERTEKSKTASFYWKCVTNICILYITAIMTSLMVEIVVISATKLEVLHPAQRPSKVPTKKKTCGPYWLLEICNIFFCSFNWNILCNWHTYNKS